MNHDQILAQLKLLTRAPGEGFKSQNECIQWANQVAPLLRFNRDLHETFSRNAEIINIVGLSATTHGTALNQMISIVQQAVTELETTEATEAETSKNSKGETIVLDFPERITLAWLFKHVPVQYWVSLAAAFLAIFIAGVTFSQTKAYIVLTEWAKILPRANSSGIEAK